MKEITAEDKDRILGCFFEADVNGNEVQSHAAPKAYIILGQ